MLKQDRYIITKDMLYIGLAISMYLGVKKININQNKVFTPRPGGGFLWAGLGRRKGNEHTAPGNLFLGWKILL